MFYPNVMSVYPKSPHPEECELVAVSVNIGSHDDLTLCLGQIFEVIPVD